VAFGFDLAAEWLFRQRPGDGANAVESLNMSLRKVIKTRGSFPTEEAAIKLLYLALTHIAKKRTMPVQDWKAALQRFAILHGDQVPKAEAA